MTALFVKLRVRNLAWIFTWGVIGFAFCHPAFAQEGIVQPPVNELPGLPTSPNDFVAGGKTRFAKQPTAASTTAKTPSEKFLSDLLISLDSSGSSKIAAAQEATSYRFTPIPKIHNKSVGFPKSSQVWKQAYQASWPAVDEAANVNDGVEVATTGSLTEGFSAGKLRQTSALSDQGDSTTSFHPSFGEATPQPVNIAQPVSKPQTGFKQMEVELPALERYDLGSEHSNDEYFVPQAVLGKSTSDRQVATADAREGQGSQQQNDDSIAASRNQSNKFSLPQSPFAENSSLLPPSNKTSPIAKAVSSGSVKSVSAIREPKPAKSPPPENTISTTQYRLAEQPAIGDHYKDETPTIDHRAQHSTPIRSDFGADPVYDQLEYDPYALMDVYEGKGLYANQRPLIELGRPWYQLGPLPEPQTWLGFHNPVTPQFIVYGDARTAVASNQFGTFSETSIATELNLNLHMQITGTERFHATITPLDDGIRNNRYLLDEDRKDEELDFDFDTGFFEGDLGAIIGGWTGETLPFDLPIAIGVMPLLVQNGVWMEDAILGAAATIPARNSPMLDISNMDITFFAGFDEIISPAFEFEDDAAKMYGMLAFIESNNGYWEIDYAFLEDRTARDRSYHNIGLAFTRRYGRFLSNSTRVIINAGQSAIGGPNTADGVLFLSENSLITGAPSTLVPYLNFFAGFDRPQSAARNAAAGGVLRNTGILFETDGMTNFPTLDPTANDTFGVAAGINLLASDFTQQLVVEVAALGVIDDDPNRNAIGDQYGLGVRYQLPLNNALILRADAMVGFLRGTEDINGARIELRHKF